MAIKLILRKSLREKQRVSAVSLVLKDDDGRVSVSAWRKCHGARCLELVWKHLFQEDLNIIGLHESG